MIDASLFFAINGLAGKWQLLDGLAIFCAEYLGYLLLIVLLALLFINFKKYWLMVVEAVGTALLVRFSLIQIMHVAWFKARPFLHYSVHPLIFSDPTDSSFPSYHASFYFALSTMVYFYNKKLGTAFLVASFCISIARIFVGVHWPSDVIAGALLGAFTAWVVHKLLGKLSY